MGSDADLNRRLRPNFGLKGKAHGHESAANRVPHYLTSYAEMCLTPDSGRPFG